MAVQSATSSTGEAERVLLVGVCAGSRCTAVRRLAAQAAASDSRELIRAAVRRRPDAVMVDLPCLGWCSEAAVAVVGLATSCGGCLTWLGRPTCLATTDRPQRARDIAEWIVDGAPDLRALPTLPASC